MNLHKIATLLLAASLSVSAVGLRAADELPRKPNVIVILVDDLGWSDVGFNGCREIPTPHLDALAKSGVRFTSGYASHMYCSPSRAGLLTGRHQQRFGHEGNPVKKTDGLPLTETLLPALLKQHGYCTAAVGKWHLGDEEAYWPTSRGFDEWFGFTGGLLSYWGKEGPDGSGILRNGKPVPKSELTHLTDDFSQESINFIERNHDQPFFLYLAYNAPHSPNHVTQAHLQKSEHIEQPGRAVYGAMVAGMDDGIGRIIRRLEELKLRERTLVFFCSDNGGRIDGATNFPLRGHKGMLFEGGIRVPFCVSWPERIPAGQTVDTPITGLDLFPTVLAATGIAVPDNLKLDGLNLLPLLGAEKREWPPRTLFWRYAAHNNAFGYAVRDGDYKLVSSVEKPKQLLFNLATDPYEHHDLAVSHPEIVAKLTAQYERWAAEMQSPLWLDSQGPYILNLGTTRREALDKASEGERSQ